MFLVIEDHEIGELFGFPRDVYDEEVEKGGWVEPMDMDDDFIEGEFTVIDDDEAEIEELILAAIEEHTPTMAEYHEDYIEATPDEWLNAEADLTIGFDDLPEEGALVIILDDDEKAEELITELLRMGLIQRDDEIVEPEVREMTLDDFLFGVATLDEDDDDEDYEDDGEDQLAFAFDDEDTELPMPTPDGWENPLWMKQVAWSGFADHDGKADEFELVELEDGGAALIAATLFPQPLPLFPCEGGYLAIQDEN